jgi:MFS family permease
MSAGPDSTPRPAPNGSVRRPRRGGGLWRSPDFVKLWVSQTVSLMGSQVSLLALPLAAVALGAGAREMGWLAAAQTLPMLLFGLPAGTWIDRLPRRPVLVATDLGQGLVLAIIPLAALLGVLHLELLYPLAFVVSTLAVLAEVAHPAYLPSLVGRPRLMEANSKMALGGQVARIAGPTAAGALVQAATAPLAILADSASFLVSAALVGTIRAREPATPRSVARRRLWHEIWEGLAIVLRHPVLRTLTGAWGLYFLFFFLFYSLYVLYATRELGLAPAALGVIVSVASVGGVVGALVTERVTARFGVGPTMAGALLVASVGMLLFPLAGGPAALAVAVLIAAQGLIRTTDQLFYINYLSVCQALTPDRLQGRVNASIRVFSAGTIPLGAFVGGLLGEAFGLRAVGFVAAAGVLLAFLWVALSPVRSMRTLPTESLDPTPVTSPPPEPDAPRLGLPDARRSAAERT